MIHLRGFLHLSGAVEEVYEANERFSGFWLDAAEDERENVQIQGTDILVFSRKRVQVKCDYRCGDRPLGTGNVFLQRAERNPLKHR